MLAGPVLQARLLFKFRRTHDPARVRPHGEYNSYSNYGATLAGHIVERVSDLPYDDYVEQNILTPLNMAHSTSRQPVPAAFAADLSEGYEFIDGQYQVQPFETVNVVPAGGSIPQLMLFGAIMRQLGIAMIILYTAALSWKHKKRA